MAITFGILAAILVTLTAWVGYKNSQAKEEQAGHLKVEKKKRDANKKENDDLTKQINGQNQSYENALIELETLFKKRDAKEQEKKELEEKLASLQSEVKALTASLEDYQDKVPNLGDVDKLIANLKEVKAAIAELDESIASVKTENDELTAKINNAKDSIAFHKEVMGNHEKYKAQKFLSTKVKAVYKNWGFVVLEDGDAKGVTPRSLLVVKRGEDIICQLVVKNATNGAATAEILFDTMKEGEFVQVGDQVVAPEEKKKPVEEKSDEEEPEEPSGGDDDVFDTDF